MRESPPFRADHVGSLLRPPTLLRGRADAANGHIDQHALREIEDAAIADAVRMQSDVGLRSATDGEFRRTSWHMDFIYALGGIRQTDDKLTVKFSNPQGGLEFEASGLMVAAPIHLRETIFGDAFTYLRSQVTSAVPKLTIPSPSMVHFRGGPDSIDRTVYPDVEQYWEDLAHAYRDQVTNLGELGCTYLQLDDISLAYLNDPAQRDRLVARGDDPEALLGRYIATMNQVIDAKPPGMTITTHMCRGNFRSSWAASGDYEFVAEQLLSDLRVDGFFMEFDDERSGSFAPLRHLAPGRQVVLGLVTTKTPQLESRASLLRRLDDASRSVDLEQVCLSPQCGFSSTVEGNEITHDDQVAKLRLVVETAAEVWGDR